MIILLTVWIFLTLTSLFLNRRFGGDDLQDAYKQYNHYLRIMKDCFEHDFVIATVTLLVLPIIVLPQIFNIIISYINGTAIDGKYVKCRTGLGVYKRTIYGYKGRIYICHNSGVYGEKPKYVIDRIKKRYFENTILHNEYIKAVENLHHETKR